MKDIPRDGTALQNPDRVRGKPTAAKHGIGGGSERGGRRWGTAWTPQGGKGVKGADPLSRIGGGLRNQY